MPHLVIANHWNKFSIPSSVASIDDGAFEGCSSSIQIIIPSSVTSIWRYAFRLCPSFIDLINYYIFYCSFRLIEIIILNSIKNIRNTAFYRCNSLVEIAIPSSITETNFWMSFFIETIFNSIFYALNCNWLFISKNGNYTNLNELPITLIFSFNKWKSF